MRRNRSLVVVAALALGAGGCLESIIPDHQQSTVTDGGTGGGAGKAGGTGGGNGNGNGSGSGTGDGGGAADVDMAPANDPSCIAAAAPTIDGHHNPGQACLQCHDGNTAGANKFTAAGTIYDKLSLAAGAQGFRSHHRNHRRQRRQGFGGVCKHRRGGKLLDRPAAGLPLHVRASHCPADRPMSAALAANANNVAAGDGNCSRTGCHDSAMIMHMP